MANQPLFALIDCNNFFASCEQVFRPGLAGKPVVVLSSNDGCVVARSAEVKALGIPMAAPAFKYRDIFKKHGVIQFSANFELYGDISRRITEILTSITPRLEVYSIDESFLDISQLDIPDYESWAKQLRQTIYDWVGVGVSIGVASSKTLAKLASERAKKDQSLQGVCVAVDTASKEWCLVNSRIEDIWGVGRKLGPRLRAIGIASALDVARLSPLQGRKILGSVNGERLVRELNGQCCLPLEQLHSEQKMISATRTFGHDTDKVSDVEAALASFVARATQRLRASHRVASRMVVFVSTDKHKPGFRRWARELILEEPTADTGHLTALACQTFQQIYEPGTLYHRGGVLLTNFSEDSELQVDLFGYRDPERFTRSRNRMRAIDRIHSRYGSKRIIQYATERLGQDWQPRAIIRSPRYTTSWEDLPKVLTPRH